ncbi:MAG: cupin domain-containing protein [Thermodesulfobacteriota bacterium]
MELIDIKERVEFAEEFRPRILKAAPGFKVPLICMEPGQEIPPHPSGTGIFFIVSGSGVMTVEGEEVEVGEGNMVFVEEGTSRGIRATERLTAFAVHIG